ncbi:hypothetical protein KY359_04195 [Candidatus Woesearchaeota archaeon]|nr:hypothetical protein [Candidatus Woesearchaeota archaeon]
MVIHESFVTRKPLEFTLIVLVIVLVLLLPVYFLTKNGSANAAEQAVFIPQTYGEVEYFFSAESDLSESDKRHLFQLQYEGNFVQWTGLLLACEPMSGLFKVSIDHSGDGFGDVMFMTDKDCSGVPLGSTATYRTRLIDWKITTFIGKDGEVLSWE